MDIHDSVDMFVIKISYVKNYVLGSEITKAIVKSLHTRFGKLIDEVDEDTIGTVAAEKVR